MGVRTPEFVCEPRHIEVGAELTFLGRGANSLHQEAKQVAPGADDIVA